jgi:uncharacterized protein (TIGR02271 family)
MPDETIVAVFETSEHAEKAARALDAAGVPASDIEYHSREREGAEGTGQSRRDSGPQGTGFFFWDMMFGLQAQHQDRSDYERRVERGETVLAVTVAEEHADTVMSVLERQSPLDLDERATETDSTEAAGVPEQRSDEAPARSEVSERQRAREQEEDEEDEEQREEAPSTRASRPRSEEAAEGEEVIPLAEESLQVGKRTVNRGTTRIRRYIVESPVEKTVPLRDERVIVERRKPVTDEVTGDALTEKTVEVTETSEVPVTEKVARLKEEVVVRREGAVRQQTVQDTVRRDEIAVEDATEAPRRSKNR